MNPEIERLMASEEAVKLEEEERRLQESREKSVTDKEMAEHYGTLAHSMGQKFKSKRLKREEASHSAAMPNKKFKFVKPEIDDYK
ncbi:hypothetical protein B566_EDAN000764 [Ephemera danica]|nr:hypothetical protein B566_EDAN000764 [Ephemera danica]